MLNAHLSSSPGRTYILSATSRPDIVVKVSDTEIKPLQQVRKGMQALAMDHATLPNHRLEQ